MGSNVKMTLYSTYLRWIPQRDNLKLLLHPAYLKLLLLPRHTAGLTFLFPCSKSTFSLPTFKGDQCICEVVRIDNIIIFHVSKFELDHSLKWLKSVIAWIVRFRNCIFLCGRNGDWGVTSNRTGRWQAASRSSTNLQSTPRGVSFGTCYFHYSYSRQVNAEATRGRHPADVVM